MEVVTGKKTKGQLHSLWVKYRREGERNKLAAKIEIQEARWEHSESFVLRQIPEISRFLLEADIKVPFGRSVILCSPVQEILAKEIKALVESPYVKGRDLYDIWYITHSLRIPIFPKLVIERTEAYPGEFVSRRSLSTYLNSTGNKEPLLALEELGRFLPPEEVQILRRQGYKDILLAVEETVRNLLEKGLNERIIG